MSGANLKRAAVCAAVVVLVAVGYHGVFNDLSIDGDIWVYLRIGRQALADPVLQSLADTFLRIRDGEPENLARPTVQLLFALHGAALGPDITRFRVVVAAYVCCCALLVYLLGRRILHSESAAAAAALVFAVLPVHTRVVAWTAGLYPLLALLLFFGALFPAMNYIDRKGKASAGWLAVSAFLFALAITSYEGTYVLPVVLLVYALCEGAWGSPPGRRRTIIAVAILLLVLAGNFARIAIQLGLNPDPRLLGYYAERGTDLLGHDWGPYLARFVRVVCELLAWPFADTPLAGSRLLIASGVVAAVLLAGAAAICKGTRRRTWLFLVLLTVIPCLPLIAEEFESYPLLDGYLMLLPSVGFCLLLGYLLACDSRPARIVGGTGLAILIAAYLFGTIGLNRMWMEEGRLLHENADALKETPLPRAGHVFVVRDTRDDMFDDNRLSTLFLIVNFDEPDPVPWYVFENVQIEPGASTGDGRLDARVLPGDTLLVWDPETARLRATPIPPEGLVISGAETYETYTAASFNHGIREDVLLPLPN